MEVCEQAAMETRKVLGQLLFDLQQAGGSLDSVMSVMPVLLLFWRIVQKRQLKAPNGTVWSCAVTASALSQSSD